MPTASTPAVAFPLSLGQDGRTRPVTDRRDAVEQLIRQLLFTRPGERLNQPDLGCGLHALVFAGETDELAATTQFLVASELQRWLGQLIRVTGVEVAAVEAELTVRVTYALADADGMFTVIVTR